MGLRPALRGRSAGMNLPGRRQLDDAYSSSPPVTMPRAESLSGLAAHCQCWHRGALPTPAAVTGSDEKIAAAFEVTYSKWYHRIDSLLALSDLNETSLQAALAEISDMD